MLDLETTQRSIAVRGRHEQRLGDIAFADGKLEAADTHYARAKVAREEHLFLYGDAEVSDPNYCAEVQELAASATHYKLVKWVLTDPVAVHET
jgi:hypothetical protein